MKKYLLTLAAAALCTSAFAAEPTVLYERTADTWTEADLTEWVNDNAQYVTQSIDGGLKMTGTNSGWNSTKEITYSELSTVTLTATLNGGGATGRAGSYDFLKLGNVEVRFDGQNKAASIVIGETTTALSGFTRGGDYEISMTIDQIYKEVTVTVAGGATGEATGKLSEALPNNVIVGHYRAGKEGYEVNETLKSIKIEEIAPQPAETTVLYDRVSDTWTEADLAEWVNDNANYVTQTIDGGLKMTGTNSGWTSTKEMSYSPNTIVTLTATLYGGQATGRAGSYDFLKLGDVEVRLDGQNKAASVVIGESTTALSGFTRGGDYVISIVVNQATKGVTVTVSGGAEGTVEGKIAEALPNNVIVGHNKAGKENYEVVEILKDIKITEETQSVVLYDYTINYTCDGQIIKTETGSGVASNVIDAVSPLVVDDQKYYFADGATTSLTISEEGDNVLNVEMRKAYMFNYTVKNNVNDEVKEGTCIEGESVTVPFSKYILKDGTVYAKAAISQQYNYSFTPDADNYEATLEYSATEMTDGIYFCEGENIEGMTEVTGANANIRCSNAAGGYADAAVEVCKLQPGTYKVIIGVWGNAGDKFLVNAGSENVLYTETTGYWFEEVGEEFTLTEETAITFEGAKSAKPLDYILITGNGKTSAVAGVEAAEAEGAWYTIQGIRVAQPTQPGLYIRGGKKVVVK